MDFDDDFLFEKDGPVRRITLNRPKKHNALSVSMQKQLHEAIRAVRFDVEARILIITGAGNTFCAGDDIAESCTLVVGFATIAAALLGDS